MNYCQAYILSIGLLINFGAPIEELNLLIKVAFAA